MPLNVGIAGLGTVGAEVARQVLKYHNDKFEITAVCVRDKGKVRDIPFSVDVAWVDDPATLVDQCDIVLELMGGTGMHVESLIFSALDKEIPVITANKAYLAENSSLLKNKLISFEAAVAGGIPVIETMQTLTRSNRIQKISGILNGTCNYILSKMEDDGAAFKDALKQAQEMGYAEADPTLDISGGDQFQKSLILARLAFGDKEVKSSAIGLDESTNNLAKQAAESDKVLRLVSDITCDDKIIHIDVRPMAFDCKSGFSGVKGPDNAIEIQADPLGTILLQGPGAGAGATASAVLGDLIKLTK